MEVERFKTEAAMAALAELPAGGVLGVGTGSTVERLIAALRERPGLVSQAVASSVRTAGLLTSAGIELVELAAALPLECYVDGADEVDPSLRLLKGGGGAHTREKVLATAAARFVCIVDESKMVERLGGLPVPLEVLPMARAGVERQLTALGGRPRLREGMRTDEGNLLLDVEGLDLSHPEALEVELDALPGVVECGLFARRPADVVLCAGPGGVRRLTRSPA
jgi:ribose 5-phosphate isomerase A